MQINSKTIRALIALFVGSISPAFAWLIAMTYYAIRRGLPVESAVMLETLKVFVILSLLGMLPGFGLGLPAYIFMARSRNISLSKCLFVGFLMGMLPIPVLFFILKSPQYSFFEHWDGYLTPFCLFETIGMGAAFITWLVWRYLPGKR